jgi:hypothetical protein
MRASFAAVHKLHWAVQEGILWDKFYEIILWDKLQGGILWDEANIACTIPFITAESERSFSALKRRN